MNSNILILSLLIGLIVIHQTLGLIAVPKIFVDKKPSAQRPPNGLRPIFSPAYGCKTGFAGKECSECGVVYAAADVKIVGGIEAVPGSWPAEVYIEMNFQKYVKIPGVNQPQYIEQRISCAGTLITSDTVVSAGHCVIDSIDFDYNGELYSLPLNITESLPYYRIGLGLQNINDNDGIYASVRNIIRHPEFSSDTLLNDISIFKLSTNVKFTRKIQIACLPSVIGYPTQVNVPVYAMGWGTTRENGGVSAVLRNVKLTLYKSVYCASVFPDMQKNWNNQICAGNYKGGQDTCQGDSGGGIYVMDTVNGKTKYVLVGIVSYGDGCAKRGKPGIYTRVSSYLPWINSLL